MTPRSLILQTSAAFRRFEIPDPETDAAFLLSHLTGRDAMELRMDMDSELSPETIKAYELLCHEREKRVPLQYLMQYQYFNCHQYYVDSRVLIPRPETAEIVSFLSERYLSYPGLRILDLCCGSGCIGIELSLALQEAIVTCADLSPDALSVAKRNAKALGATVNFAQGNLLHAVPNQIYDLIVSNPPYIPSAECDVIQPEVSYEPRMALDGGTDGLDFYRAIISEASSHLVSGGMIVFEIGIGEANLIADLLRKASFDSILIRKDFRGIERMVAACKPTEVLSCSKDLSS